MNFNTLHTRFRRERKSETADLVSFVASDAAKLAHESANRLWRRVARECEAMAEHAYSTGLGIPGEVAALIDEALATFGLNDVLALPTTRQEAGDRQNSPPLDKFGGTGASSIALLSKAHAALTLIIKPATPEAVLLLIEERRTHSFWYAFGPLPIVRQMLGLAILSLLTLLIVSLSSDINTDSMSKTLLQMQGLQLLAVEIFLLSAASLGSCFQNLQQISAYISSGTYDPKFQSTYWTRWVMGLISGIVFSQIIFELVVSIAGSNNGPRVMPAIVGQPVLALLGGYSVDVVHGVLSHIIDSFGSFFRTPSGAPGEGSTVDVAAAAASRERLTIASEVSELRGSLGGDTNSDEILRRFDEMIRRNIATVK
jgi:hypothetical protein